MFRHTVTTLANAPSIATGLTALAGGGKSGATQMAASINVFTTVATAGDSSLLPPALGGNTVFVRNDGAASMNVFGQGTDTINTSSTSTAFAVGAGKGAIFVSDAAGAWRTVLSA